MTAEVNTAVAKQPVAIEWETLTDPDNSWALKRLPFDEACARLLQEAYFPKYDPEFHRLSKVIWNDGSHSWANSSHNPFEEVVRIVSTDGKPLLTLHKY